MDTTTLCFSFACPGCMLTDAWANLFHPPAWNVLSPGFALKTASHFLRPNSRVPFWEVFFDSSLTPVLPQGRVLSCLSTHSTLFIPFCNQSTSICHYFFSLSVHMWLGPSPRRYLVKFWVTKAWDMPLCHWILPVTLGTMIDPYLHLQVRKLRAERERESPRMKSVQAGESPWPHSPGVHLCPAWTLARATHLSAMADAACNGAFTGQWVAQPGAQPKAMNRLCLSWHSHQVRVQGLFPLGSWGWGPSKNTTQAGPAGGWSHVEKHSSQNKTVFLQMTSSHCQKAQITPPLTFCSPPTGTGKTSSSGPVTSLRQK